MHNFMRFATDPTVRRLRWVMIGSILFDLGITLAGQPSSYFHDPHTVNELNGFFSYFYIHGLSAFILTILIYPTLVFCLVSVLPRRLALVTAFAFTLGHYFGASTWLVYHWQFGINAPIIYGVILSVLFVHLAFPSPDKANAKNLQSDEPAA